MMGFVEIAVEWNNDGDVTPNGFFECDAEFDIVVVTPYDGWSIFIWSTAVDNDSQLE